jgi:hyperosmotically inducible protein
MKTIKHLAAILALGLLFTPVAGYSADKEPFSVGEFVSDSIITTKIKAEYAKDKHVSAMDIKVDTDKDGVVVLSGTADSRSEVEKAVSIAKSVEGVTKVHSRIKIKKDD